MNTSPSTSQTPVTILLVEDEVSDAYLVTQAFQENHIAVDLHHVVDGVEALEFLQRQGKYGNAPRPDLILLDLNMPRMDGRRFLAEIKQDDHLATIPVVILTTSDVERDTVSSYRTGAAGYIVKPIDMEQFIDVIKVLEEYWFTLVRLAPKRTS
ncbi:MAG: response regulator [Actinomycetota bacterium]